MDFVIRSFGSSDAHAMGRAEPAGGRQDIRCGGRWSDERDPTQRRRGDDSGAGPRTWAVGRRWGPHRRRDRGRAGVEAGAEAAKSSSSFDPPRPQRRIPHAHTPGHGCILDMRCLSQLSFVPPSSHRRSLLAARSGFLPAASSEPKSPGTFRAPAVDKPLSHPAFLTMFIPLARSTSHIHILSFLCLSPSIYIPLLPLLSCACVPHPPRTDVFSIISTTAPYTFRLYMLRFSLVS